MKKDNFFKFILVIIAFLLFLNFFTDKIFPKASASSYPISTIVCSHNGQHLYAAIGDKLIYSADFGRTWNELNLYPWN